MTKRPDIFKVGVAGAPVIDWKIMTQFTPKEYLKIPEDNENGYYLSSPLNFIENLSGDY